MPIRVMMGIATTAPSRTAIAVFLLVVVVGHTTRSLGKSSPEVPV